MNERKNRGRMIYGPPIPFASILNHNEQEEEEEEEEDGQVRRAYQNSREYFGNWRLRGEGNERPN